MVLSNTICIHEINLQGDGFKLQITICKTFSNRSWTDFKNSRIVMVQIREEGHRTELWMTSVWRGGKLEKDIWKFYHLYFFKAQKINFRHLLPIF